MGSDCQFGVAVMDGRWRLGESIEPMIIRQGGARKMLDICIRRRPSGLAPAVRGIMPGQNSSGTRSRLRERRPAAEDGKDTRELKTSLGDEINAHGHLPILKSAKAASLNH